MRFISWNVNGLRAIMKKNFMEDFENLDADFFCLQEIKLQKDQIEMNLSKKYYSYWNYAEKKGYSGTAIFTKHKPISVFNGMGILEHDDEGRMITLEYENFYFITVYTPNSQRELARIEYRMKWEDDFLIYLKELEKKKPVIVCGDLNVAHNEIDLRNPKTNKKNAGFSPQERGKFSTLLENGFIDTFRHFYPEKEDAYTWWSYMYNARKNNIGWRIDYFITSKSLKDKLKNAVIHSDILGSDHCPVELETEKLI